MIRSEWCHISSAVLSFTLETPYFIINRTKDVFPHTVFNIEQMGKKKTTNILNNVIWNSAYTDGNKIITQKWNFIKFCRHSLFNGALYSYSRYSFFHYLLVIARSNKEMSSVNEYTTNSVAVCFSSYVFFSRFLLLLRLVRTRWRRVNGGVCVSKNTAHAQPPGVFLVPEHA